LQLVLPLPSPAEQTQAVGISLTNVSYAWPQLGLTGDAAAKLLTKDEGAADRGHRKLPDLVAKRA
jgi:hypothetical protein